jgi:predicted nuclease of predicted toxin-antitoxin system
MIDPSGTMRFFIDHCVPESVAVALEQSGYEVIRLREKTATDSPDTLVAAVSEANNAILVTMDSDFKKIASRTGIGQSRYRRLSLIRFEKCRESRAASRLTDALSLIEHEWAVGNGRDRRMFVVITTDTIRTHR